MAKLKSSHHSRKISKDIFARGKKLIAIKAIRNLAFSSLKIGSFDAEVFSLT
jgi:hypothetical protein